MAKYWTAFKGLSTLAKVGDFKENLLKDSLQFVRQYEPARELLGVPIRSYARNAGTVNRQGPYYMELGFDVKGRLVWPRRPKAKVEVIATRPSTSEDFIIEKMWITLLNGQHEDVKWQFFTRGNAEESILRAKPKRRALIL